MRSTGTDARDTLGKVPGREAFNDSLVSALAETVGGDTVVVLLVGLDHFKDVNGAFGHDVGDGFLAEVADRIRRLDRANRTVARVGGDVFAVIEAVTSSESFDAADLAATVSAVLDAPFTTPNGDVVQLSGTLGVAWSSLEDGSATSLLRHAEIAMYRAKTQHQHWASYDAHLDEMTADRLAHVADLRRAILAEELTVHYQPVVELATGRAVAIEALVRWRHPVRGMVPPIEFIPLAEENGLISGVTRLVILEVAAQMRRWRALGWQLPCAINVSAHCLTDPLCSEPLVSTLAEMGGWVTVEVTESAIVEPGAVVTLERLAEAGVPSAIDDFGTGYASLGTLKALPTTTLKIDRSLIKDIEADQRDFDVAQGVVSLARSFGLDVIAEGIETQAAARRLLDAGVVQGQGFWFARPMPADELERWMDEDAQRLELVPRTAREPADGGGRQQRDHAVVFYDTDAQRLESVAHFLSAGLEADQHVMVIATSRHRAALLSAFPRDLRVKAEREGRLVVLDARETLAMFMREGQPDRVRFDAQVARLVRDRASGPGVMQVYSDMATMLWSDGNVAGALKLEDLWTDLQRHVPISVLCAYPLDEANAAAHAGFARLCGSHTAVRFNQRARPDAADPDAQELRVLLDAARQLLGVESPMEAAAVVDRAVTELGGTTALAESAGDDAIAIDISLGCTEPTLPAAPMASATRARLERVLPGLVENAKTAVRRAAQVSALTAEAETDPLTGLLNRRGGRRLRTSAATAILLDLEGLSRVNAEHGFPVGDEVLRAFARTLRSILPEGAEAVRVDGDDFMLLMPGTSTESARRVIDRLRSAWTRDRPLPVSFTVGGAGVGEQGHSNESGRRREHAYRR